MKSLADKFPSATSPFSATLGGSGDFGFDRAPSASVVEGLLGAGEGGASLLLAALELRLEVEPRLESRSVSS